LKNILIIGGTGFFASYLKPSLKKKYNIDFTYSNHVAHDGIKYQAGVTLLKDIITRRYDVIINNINPRDFGYSELIKCMEDIIHYCNDSDIKLIHISSVSALIENRYSNSYNLKKAISEDLIQAEMSGNNYSIIRFTQLFDAKGLASSSQIGFYYLLDCIKNNKQILVFKNQEECYRNYTPVEIAVKCIEICIANNFKGVFNAHLDNFTFSFKELLQKLTSLNENYNVTELVIKGDKFGLPYYIAKQNDELVSKIEIDTEIMNYYSAAYNLV
jgi:nucleoside-diphosphate-sugar epimerase